LWTWLRRWRRLRRLYGNEIAPQKEDCRGNEQRDY
jgi:hypothetical protein